MHRTSPRPLPKLAPPASLWRRLRAWARGTFRKLALDQKRKANGWTFARMRWDRELDRWVWLAPFGAKDPGYPPAPRASRLGRPPPPPVR